MQEEDSIRETELSDSFKKMFHSISQQQQTHLVSAKKLSEWKATSSPQLVILDASIPMPGEKRDCHGEFLDKHIPGARFLDLQGCRDVETDNAYMLPTAEKFVDYLQKLGVSSYSKVVVYDANEKKGIFSSPRAWYMFRVFGHREIYILDGGLSSWISEGR